MRRTRGVVEIIGMIAAALAAATSLRRTRVRPALYSVPVALAALKLPCGALTALVGLLLIQGDFVPGFNSLDSSAQILAWAIVFGYAQQLFTRLVDERAYVVLGETESPEGRTVTSDVEPQRVPNPV